MKTFIKGMFAVGIAWAVLEMLRRAGRRQTNARPNIVVSGGEGLRVHVADGRFEKVGDDVIWYHEHSGAPPSVLRVTVSGTICSFDPNNRVEIYCRGKHDPVLIQREVDKPGGEWHSYVRPPQGTPYSMQGKDLLFWPDAGYVDIESVEVGDVRCAPPATVVIAQVP